MHILPILGLPAGVWQNLADSLILAILALPALYAVGFRPPAQLPPVHVRGYLQSEKLTLIALSGCVALVTLIGCLQSWIESGQESGTRIISRP